MSERELDLDTFARLLTEARFDEIFEDGELEQFYIFLRNRAVPAGSCVVSFPVIEGGLIWVHFEIKDVKEKRGKLVLEFGRPMVLIPDDPSDRAIPEALNDVPVWWLGGNNV